MRSIKLAIFSLVLAVFILSTGCGKLSLHEAVVVISKAQSYYVEYTVQDGSDGEKFSVKEWFKQPDKLYQQIFVDDSLLQEVWIYRGNTTIRHAELDDCFMLARPIDSDLQKIYKELEDSSEIRKNDEGYKITASAILGTIELQCNKKGTPLSVHLYDNNGKVLKAYQIETFDLNCNIKDSVFEH